MKRRLRDMQTEEGPYGLKDMQMFDNTWDVDNSSSPYVQVLLLEEDMHSRSFYKENGALVQVRIDEVGTYGPTLLADAWCPQDYATAQKAARWLLQFVLARSEET